LGGEKLKRKFFFLFGIFFTIAFLLTSFDSVYATLTIDETSKIPTFLLHWSESWAKGNLTELKRIRAQIVSQLEWNEEMIKSTNGAVLQKPPAGYRTTFTHVTVDQWTDKGINPYYPDPWDEISWVENPYDLGGQSSDGECTRLVAINFFNDWWGEALTHCHPVEAPLLYGGGIYADAKKGPLTGQEIYPYDYEGEWCNYLIAMVALDPVSMWDWNFVGYAPVFSSSITTYYLGDSYNFAPYNHVSISTACPGNWYPIERNDVLVDFVEIIGYP
jgi:hypothetical protein